MSRFLCDRSVTPLMRRQKTEKILRVAKHSISLVKPGFTGFFLVFRELICERCHMIVENSPTTLVRAGV
jgi:hypothetical protein